jgi:RNA polymerase sigma-70 factor (ECF subfamily)
MRLLLARKERAFERIYRRHVGDVYHYALAVLRDPLDAEEVTQTTFLNAYRGFRRGRRARLQLNSLLAIAHEVCRLRGGHIRLDEADLLADEEEEQTTAADVRRALGRLSFDQRAVLVMREVEGRSYAEIAQILTLSVSRVEALIFEARHALREELDGSLTCHQAELAISRRLDDRLSRRERRLLRRHLRACEECEAFARSQQAQRIALRALAAIPLPETLQSFFGSRPAPTGARLAARITAIGGTMLLVVTLASLGGVPHP